MRKSIPFLQISALVLILTSYSCNNDESESQNRDPEVLTLDATVSPNGGVNLSGSYLSNGNTINEIGFEYATDSLIINSSRVTSEIDSTNDIEVFLANGLQEGFKYYYKAFVQSSGESFYGETKSFISNGSAAPEIDAISNEFGIIGDTLQIFGRYFKDNNYETVLDFSEINAEIISLNDSIITCKVPLNINNVVNDIRVRIDNRADTFSSFILLPPEIESISSLNGTFRDELTITGNNFDFSIARNTVYFGDVEATIIYADKTTLRVIVPDDLENSTEQIRVIAQLQEVTFEENFQLIPPELTFVPQDVFANQDISIQGAYFHPILDRNIITIEDIQVDLFSGNTELLETKIPLGPFPRRKAIVRIQLLDLIVEYELELNILDKWVMVSNDLPFRFNRSVNNAVVAQNTAFVIAPEADDFSEIQTLYLWKLHLEDFTWEQSALPFTMKWSGISVSNGDKLFVYEAQGGNSFWAYDPSSEQWDEMSSFPGARRDYPTHFSVNGEVYIGMGADFETSVTTTYSDFYKYSPSSDSWTEIAEFSYQNFFLRTETSTFTINGIAYVGNGATNTGMVDFWSYHPNSDEWIRITDFPDSRRYTGSFELNGFGYVTGGTPTGGSNRNDCWKYNPTTNTWSQEDDIGLIARAGHFSFALNGKAYIGGGGIFDSGGTNGFDFYEYLP